MTRAQALQIRSAHEAGQPVDPIDLLLARATLAMPLVRRTKLPPLPNQLQLDAGLAARCGRDSSLMRRAA